MKKRLSNSISELNDHYKVVVIGSGYGGSIVASRMARAGLSVCLLEKGKEIRPGDYPNTEATAVKEMHVNSAEFQIGNENNLYQFAVNNDISVFHGCGLGGTSLINANVSLPPEEWVLRDEAWPKEIRNDLTSLFDGIKKAKKILQPSPYPVGQNGYKPLPKVEAQKKSARSIGGAFKYTPINVQFKDGLNAVGYEQKKCNNCGDCVTGCNIGAKNTTLMNYLPDAKNYGAQIFTGINVSHLSQNKQGKWLIHYQVFETGAAKFSSEEQFITADFVFLAAGTLGSTKLLLQSRVTGLTTSNQLGKHFTGNGDVLGFAYNANQQISGVGLGPIAPSAKYTAPGPCIASVIDTRKEGTKEEGMVIEEGAIPGALSSILPNAFIPLSKLVGIDTDSGIMDFLKEKGREYSSFFGGAYTGALRNTQTYLVMTHDDGKGEMSLENNRLKINWDKVGEQEIFKLVNDKLERASKALGATYMTSPGWNKLMNYDLVTVHPLGGCIMGEDAAKGVVNHKGQVYKSETGNEVYPNLIVCDGSIIPRPLGVNPLLTISGLAERNCALIATDNNWTIFDGNKPIDFDTKKLKPGIQFTEKMTGHIVKITDTDLSYEKANTAGKTLENDFAFILTIRAEDVETFLNEPGHETYMFGTVNCRLLSSKTISIQKGFFNLFVNDNNQVNTLSMKYRMEMQTEEGVDYYFEGIKEIKDERGSDAWKDLTTLYVDIYHGHDAERKLFARGILYIEKADLLKQMQTISAINTTSKKEALQWVLKFSKFFTHNVISAYGGVLNKINLFNPDEPVREQRILKAPIPKSFPFKAKDGVDLMLTRFKGGDKGPIMLVHGLGVSSLIFSIDTIEVNLVEYLAKEGYDLWLIDNRLSTKLPCSENRASADEVAINDYQPAIELIKQQTGKDKIHALVHCFGSTTFIISMLSGLKDVASILVSQIGPHMKSAMGNLIKAKLHVADILERIGTDKLTAETDTHDSWKAKVFNSFLKFYPNDEEDKTIDPVSNRITFLYGQLYELDQLNQQTFGALHELFGVANIDAFTHLSEMIRAEKVVNKKGEDVYLANIQNALALPITFIHGEENACFLPESTEISYNTLKQLNPEIFYERHVIPNYGHIDCIFGKNAYKDVYPYILAHFKKHCN